jgi:hypothetical protein
VWLGDRAAGQCKHNTICSSHNKADVQAFEQVIRAANTTWLHCEPWHEPATLRRVWCLYEALKTIELGNALDLMMAPAEVESLQATLTRDFDKIMGYIADIDASQAEATNPDDKAMIFGLIEDRPGGFQQFNADVIAALRRWLLDTALGRLRELEGGAPLNVVDTRDASFQELDDMRGGCGRLLSELGQYDEAEPLYRECCSFAEAVHGAESKQHATALNNLAELLRVSGSTT